MTFSPWVDLASHVRPTLNHPHTMTSISGIPTTRVSDLLVQQRVLQHVQYHLRELLRLEEQLSTGEQFQLVSEDPVAGLRTRGLQSLLERKEQVKSNLATTQSYLSATDLAMSRISGLITEVRGVALGAVGTVVTDEQRAAAVMQVEEVIEQLVSAGNQKFRNRYLFAGSTSSVLPFQTLPGDAVAYRGNEELLWTYSDVDALTALNLTGSTAFGAISDPVRGSVDLSPILTYNTRLADLRGGDGIAPGSIAVSDGTSVSIVDISAAETIADVAELIRANPPDGRTIDVEITATGLKIQLDPAPGSLSVREVSGGTTAWELGILTETGVGNNPITGDDLDPILRNTTRLDDILGARAAAVIHSDGADNDLIVEADERGSAYNDTVIRFVDDPAVAVGGEFAVYSAPGEIEVHIDETHTRARHVVDAINAAGLGFTARLDPLDEQYGGEGLILETPPGQEAQTTGGNGIEFDQASGLQIESAGSTYTIDLTTAETIEDLLNSINGCGAGLLAEINQTATGIDVRSRVSGVDFAIGENGGNTASQLGLRTFTEETRLEELNFGRLLSGGDRVGGVRVSDGVDFTIQLTDGTVLDIDLTTEETIGDVLDLINTVAGGSLEARLSRYGNGIELIDENSGPQTLVVTQTLPSMAAIDLGLIPEGQQTSNPPTAGTLATALWDDGSQADNELQITAVTESFDYNGVTLNVHDDGASVGNVPVIAYDPVTNTLDIQIENGVTTANDVITELAGTPSVAALFTITNYGGSTGSGTLTDADPAWQSVSLSGGQPEILTGADVHPMETEGIFTALVRLKQGLEANDQATIQRAVDLLDTHVIEVNLARSELGARQQGLDVVFERLESEEVELRQTLSLEYDAELTEVVSNLSARQLALEAALMATAKIHQMTLLDYL